MGWDANRTQATLAAERGMRIQRLQTGPLQVTIDRKNSVKEMDRERQKVVGRKVMEKEIIANEKEKKQREKKRVGDKRADKGKEKGKEAYTAKNKETVDKGKTATSVKHKPGTQSLWYLCAHTVPHYIALYHITSHYITLYSTSHYTTPY